jgi:hypothetical protein
MALLFDTDEIAARIAADPLDRTLFDRLGRERAHDVTIRRVNRLYLFASTRMPVTMRQGYYHLDTLALIAKTEVGYQIVQVLMNEMVEADIIDPDWVVDLSREPYLWPGYISPNHALNDAAERYYKDLWREGPHYVQTWIEKLGLIETIRPACERRNASLWPARGYSSRTFLRRATKAIIKADKPTFVFLFGDYDASGWFAHQHIEEMLNEYARRESFRHPITFERVALSAEQIGDLRLPTRPSKERDEHGRPIPSAPAFRAMQEEMTPDLVGQSCELDAVDPNHLRGLVEDRLTRHMSDARLAELEAQQAEEKAEMEAIWRAHLHGWRP